MNFNVIEHCVISKSYNEKDSEDFIFIGNSYFAVIDGATAKSSKLFKGETPGRAIGKVIIRVLSSLKPNLGFQEVFSQLNQSICSEFYPSHTKNTVSDLVDKPSASIVIISAHKDELWLLGDCNMLIDGNAMSFPKEIDIVNAGYRSLINQCAIMKGTTHEDLQENDIGRNAIMEALKEQKWFQNSKKKSQFCYGALDGSKEANDFIKCFDISNVKDLVIATDGYLKLFNTLAETENHLKQVLEGDPLMIYEYPQTKGLMKGNRSFDDRAYLRLGRSQR